MTPEETAWLAGLLEGEGAFGCSGAKARPQSRTLRIQLNMTDEDVVRKAAVLMENAPVYRYSKKKDTSRAIKSTKDAFHTYVVGYGAERIMELILPYMGNRRTARINEVLALYRSRPVKLRERNKMADCHPDRSNKGGGLCAECYRHARYLQKDLPRRQQERAVKLGLGAGAVAVLGPLAPSLGPAILAAP